MSGGSEVWGPSQVLDEVRNDDPDGGSDEFFRDCTSGIADSVSVDDPILFQGLFVHILVMRYHKIRYVIESS